MRKTLLGGGECLFWIVVRSYKNNLRRYAFAIIALALATLVCSLGLSGVQLMSQLWRYPFLNDSGGHIRIKHTDGGRWDLQRLVSQDQIYGVVKSIYPEAEITSTLHVPSLIHRPIEARNFLEPIIGRSGGLATWYLNPPLLSGTALSEDNIDEEVFLLGTIRTVAPSSSIPIPTRIASYELKDGLEEWNLLGTGELRLAMIGATGRPIAGNLRGHLGAVQRLSNTPADRVHVVGIALQGLQAEVDSRIELLREKLAAEMPELSVFTVDDYGEIVAEDLVPLRDAAQKYTPVLLLISLQVVIATALAIVHSRRRELSILRIIGFSYRKIWLLFTLECLFSAALACALGLIGSKITAYFLFGSSAVSLLPFVFAFLASLLVSLLVGHRAVSKSIPSVLRNA